MSPRTMPVESAIPRRFKFTRDESIMSQAIAGVVVPVSRILRASRQPLR
jgi:hypothetical protein